MDDRNDNERDFYRVSYAPGDELIILVGGLEFRVANISESGMRVLGASLPFTENGCVGEICWRDGQKTVFRGFLQRRDARETVLCDVEGIPFQQILKEQQRLIREQKREENVGPLLKIYRED